MLYKILRTLFVLILLHIVLSLADVKPLLPVKLDTYEMRKLICNRPQYIGDCRGRRKMWYYDKSKSKCRSFWYSNCGGNENRFYTLEACRKFCQTVDVKYEKEYS